MRSRHRKERLADVDSAYEARWSDYVCDRRDQETRPGPDIQHSLTRLGAKRSKELIPLCNHVGRYINGKQSFRSRFVELQNTHPCGLVLFVSAT
jgi:hypothetical protein